MTDSSVFAHVVLRNNAPEPTATLALEYLLGHEDALFKFAELWPEEIREKVKPRRVESETTHGDEDARPDLSIYDDSNTCRVLVENKFWAGPNPSPAGQVPRRTTDQRCRRIAPFHSAQRPKCPRSGKNSNCAAARRKYGTNDMRRTHWRHCQMVESSRSQVGVAYLKTYGPCAGSRRMSPNYEC